MAHGTPDLDFVPSLTRRRLSPMGRGMLHCAGKVCEGLGPVTSVFASQHGDPARTLPVLSDLAQGLDASPTQFSMNVHNAIAGIWSIVRGDRSPSTSLAAGAETFGWGLMEALAQHEATGEPVLYVYGDDRLPDLLAPFEPCQPPLHAVALLLGTPATRRLRLEIDPGSEGRIHPLGQSQHALLALAGGPEAEAWTGPGGAWTWGLGAP